MTDNLEDIQKALDRASISVELALNGLKKAKFDLIQALDAIKGDENGS